MATLQMQYARWQDVEIEQLSSTIGRQFVHTDTLMLARVLMKKGAHVPLHSHPNEQITYILEGSLLFHIDGREILVRAGEVLTIPPHMPHEAFAMEDTVDLDIFNPPRQDWIDREDAYLRQEAPDQAAINPLVDSSFRRNAYLSPDDESSIG